MAGNARFFDGRSTIAHQATVHISDRCLILYPGNGSTVSYQIDELVLCEEPSGPQPLRLRPRTDNGARIVIEDAQLMQDFRAQFPKLTVAEGSSRFRLRLFLGLSALAACIGGFLWFGIPAAAGIIADFYPRDQEIRLGQTARDQIISLFALQHDDDLPPVCPRNRDAERALAGIMRQLSAHGGLEYDYDVTIVRSNMANAFALPGGQIVVLSGLLKITSSPEALAGILAHEIGHNEMQHGLKKMFSGIALGQIIRLFGGGIEAPIDYLLQHGYSREMEHAADLYALDLLKKAKIESGDTATLLRSLSRKTAIHQLFGKMPEILQSHPGIEGRIALFREAKLTGKVDIPHADWLALRNLCVFD